MAKLNKIMPPRNTTIRGQDHLLAYITPEEAALLKARGGSGEPGPMGIPQYGYGDDDGGGYGDGDSDTGGMGSGDPDTGGFGGGGYGEDPGFDGGGGGSAQTETVSLGGSSGGGDSYAPQFGPDVANAMAQAEQNRLAQQVAQSYFDYSNIFDPSVYSSKRIGGDFFGGLKRGSLDVMRGVPSYSSWFAPGTAARTAFANMALDQLRSPNAFTGQTRMENAKSGFGLPGLLGGLLSIPGTMNLEAMIEDLENGGRPVLDASGKVQGVFSQGAFGEVYQGNPVEGLPETGWTPLDTQGGYDDQTVRPVNPETGQCDEGYMFDEDLQACRLDTGYQAAASTGGAFGAPGDQYARMGLLDVAPTGLPQFQQRYGAGFGSPTDFAAANTAFRRQGAYEPANFQNPYPTTGYTLLS
jgi:hypothetical protein